LSTTRRNTRPIAERGDQIAGLCRQFGVTRPEAFGSAARARDFDSLSSDADFLVRFAPRPGLSPASSILRFR
jgi:predicted nucleotidyltransferase